MVRLDWYLNRQNRERLIFLKIDADKNRLLIKKYIYFCIIYFTNHPDFYGFVNLRPILQDIEYLAKDFFILGFNARLCFIYDPYQYLLDRRLFSNFILNFYVLFKYSHVLTNKLDFLLLINLTEFLIDFWIKSYKDKSFRKDIDLNLSMNLKEDFDLDRCPEHYKKYLIFENKHIYFFYNNGLKLTNDIIV